MENYVQYLVTSNKGGGKFFEITVNYCNLILRDGKIGSKGVERILAFDDLASVHKCAEKYMSEKISKGYIAYPKTLLTVVDENLKDTKIIQKNIKLTDFPPKFLQLQEMFEFICANVNEDYREDLRSEFSRRFKSGAWAWDPITKPVPYDQVDRLGEVIMGAIYTCAEYEWPEGNGYPMAPLIQLDLKKSGQIGGVDLGDGLLQVWMPHKAIMGEDQFVRVIPIEFVDINKITPIVNIPKEMKPLQVSEDVWDEDAEDLVKAPAYQITGYAEKRFTIQLKHTIQDNFKINNLTLDKKVEAKIRKFDKTLESLMKEGRKGCLPSNWHLFGTFYDIQYNAEDRPPPIFCFDGEEFGCNWGDGSAQLFYSIKSNGRIVFWFDWSCF